MVNLNSDFWSQADGTYSSYVMSKLTIGGVEHTMCTVTQNEVTSADGSIIPTNCILNTGGYEIAESGLLGSAAASLTNEGTILSTGGLVKKMTLSRSPSVGAITLNLTPVELSISQLI